MKKNMLFIAVSLRVSDLKPIFLKNFLEIIQADYFTLYILIT